MCENRWEEVKYEHVPSIAIFKYRKAWGRHDQVRFAQFLEKVESGETKINAATLFPHNIVHSVLQGEINKQLDLQWKALPDYVRNDTNFLPISDVSGSMAGVPMEVSIALGIYLAEKNKSKFHNYLITFSEIPDFHILKGQTITEKVTEVRNLEWGGSTNLEATFKMILDQAVKWNLPAEEMPKALVILSDMQFNQATIVRRMYDRKTGRFSDKTSGGWDLSAQEMLENMYRSSGYEMPNIIYWNLRNSTGVPVEFDKSGTALVSGFSPSIMMQILNGEMNPLSIVLKTLNQERYNSVTL
jgi:hypothetical protein